LTSIADRLTIRLKVAVDQSCHSNTVAPAASSPMEVLK